MNLLADECISAEVVARLRADWHTVEAAGDDAPGAPHAGVVLLRLAGMPPADRAEAVSAVFRDRAADLPGNFTVVEPDAIRVRRPSNTSPPGTSSGGVT